MKCCVSTNVGTWTNWLIIEPDPDHSADAGTGLLSPISYKLRNFGALPRLPASCAATQNFTSGKSHGAPLERAVVLKWFYSLSRWKTFVVGTCALSSGVPFQLLLVLLSRHLIRFANATDFLGCVVRVGSKWLLAAEYFNPSLQRSRTITPVFNSVWCLTTFRTVWVDATIQ